MALTEVYYLRCPQKALSEFAKLSEPESRQDGISVFFSKFDGDGFRV
jgi:hypothetical protein